MIYFDQEYIDYFNYNLEHINIIKIKNLFKNLGELSSVTDWYINDSINIFKKELFEFMKLYEYKKNKNKNKKDKCEMIYCETLEEALMLILDDKLKPNQEIQCKEIDIINE